LALAAGADPAAAGAAAHPTTIAGLRLNKGLTPFATVYLHALMTGSPDQREVRPLLALLC
jgi:hypothetical protein